MLDDALKSEIQSAYRRVLEALELTPRYGQRLMIAEISRTLAGIETDEDGKRVSDEHVCVLEAGTGTGKTLAYLLAALPVAKARGKRLVLATATVALQEQVLHQDLPSLKAHSGLSFDFALAKGRGRYVCVAKLDAAMDGAEENPTLSLFEQSLDAATGDDFKALVAAMGDAYGNGRWEGDRDSWGEAIDDSHWRRLTVDHRQCTNRRCGHFGACAFFRARRDLDQADVIVANHDLVLADLALGGGLVLPDPADCIYVFDEGHHLPDKAISHFTHRFSVGGGLRWLRNLRGSLTELNTALGVQPTLARLLGALPTAMEALEPRLGEVFALGHQLAERPHGLNDDEDGAQHRFEMGRVPEALRAQAEALVVPFAELCRLLESMTDILRESLDPEKSTGLAREQAEAWLPLLALLHGRALEAHALWQAFAEGDPADAPPRARWLTLERFQGEPELIFSASPVSAAHTLARSLWGRCHGAVVTSATLTALGRFERLQERAGLANRYRYQRLPSPFDYSRAVLSVPREAVDPADRDGHERAIVDFVEALDDKEAVLVLFSSRAQLRGVEKALSRERRERVLAQDRLPKRELVSRHRQRIDAGEGSILFGLASFAEGIDLPGDYLTHVVITRLPFAVPDDPVGATLAEWIESQGGNPFMRISVPDASIKLVQACGRLIRKEADRGRITLLDRRVLTRRYGRALLDALPPFVREIDGVSQAG
ncbi:ATP-dependent DNA helicase DinG [Halomonas sp. S2151]|uniref:ATP-dependent DNA helicase DinG n=2 Tax=Halomonas TaxID=2745 RepID=A0ABX5IY69_9GAMM|nr:MULTISPECIES: ATP-dependent DNA helicase DinG [Halomonas]MBR9769707.1 ATP-dependent DNA helicase DinG [Gammaproteobacteria bacterium]KJZ10603.1 ATP-dependent DNA helicase DinG [Halomonas sp. S2151]MBY6112243.1 ATP-dependent DNA helicase DinG [Halomonas sp. DP1Y21-3]PTL90446.1 ATP-dependent DNA helicase DinG [Halomonas sp. SYSU XM8]PTL94334.1 ATP-dependent DNA helicase DinG [Halomonas litopenaei]